jgi:beta-glucosidase/6-phospho-beta-glucosidase/beta-galactosidase
MALAPPYAQDGLATAPARLVLVDFKTQARTPKLSASFYRDVVSKNAIGA